MRWGRVAYRPARDGYCVYDNDMSEEAEVGGEWGSLRLREKPSEGHKGHGNIYMEGSPLKFFL